MSENLSMKYFMREELKRDEIVEIPGIEKFKDDKGNIIPFKVKIIGIEEIRKIQKAYTKNKVVMENGKPVLNKGGTPVVQKEMDAEAATNRIIVEALVYPDLKDKETMAFYDCINVVEMPLKLFRNAADYAKVSTAVIETLGLKEVTSGSSEEELTDDEIIQDAKN